MWLNSQIRSKVVNTSFFNRKCDLGLRFFDLKPKILVDGDQQFYHKDAMELLVREAHIVFGPITGEIVEKHDDAVAILALGVRVNEPFLQRLPALKLVARFGVGYDAVDVSACTRRGIYVTITTQALSETVADLTLGFIIGLARNLVNADRYVRTEWATDPGRFSYGVDLQKKILGIVGLGRIGFQVAKRARAFDMEILYTDVVPRKELETAFNAKRVSLGELLQEADFVSLHCPLSEETRGLIGKKELDLMKPTAYLINTSRGAVVDQKALFAALHAERIRGAALDVFDPEPALLDDPILTLPNVIATPHIGSATMETRRRMALSCVDEILRVIRGERPMNIVPEQEGLLF